MNRLEEKMRITIGTRKSLLAMWQANTVAAALEAAGIQTRIQAMQTLGDRVLDRSIAKIGGKGVFTAELEEQLSAGLVDIAVHSAKDMQSVLPEGFALIAFTEREKVNDVLVGTMGQVSLEDSANPLTVGTSSVRRRAFLNNYYPHIKVVDMRGNLQTRIRKMQRGDCDALLLAYAGVKRMGYEEMIVHQFDVERFTPPVGQGCIAIEAATNLDREKYKMIRDCLNRPDSETCLLAERAFLRKLEGGCSIPAFAYASLDSQKNELTLSAGLASLDGKKILRKVVSGPAESSEALGAEVGDFVLSHGGRALLEEIRRFQSGA